MAQRGFSLTETLVALLLLAMTAVALLETLLTAARMQRTSGGWMQAVMLAEQALEQGRSNRTAGDDTTGSFRRQWSCTDFDPALGLERIDAFVEGDVSQPQSLHLVTLARR